MISMEATVNEFVGLLHDERTPDGMFHPSSMWGCDRRAVYDVRGVPHSNPHSAATRRRFRIGHVLHSFISESLATSPDVVRHYAEFEIGSGIEAGNGDALIELEDGTWVVVEVKSTKEAHPKLDERHARQAAHYAVHARTRGVRAGDEEIPPLGDRLTGVLLVYVGKDALDVTEYWLPYETAWEQRLDDRLVHLGTYKDDPKSLPPRLTNAKSTKSRACYGCPWVDLCWNRDPANVDPTIGHA